MAFEELKQPDIKDQLQYAPDQQSQAKILSQFADKYTGFREGNSLILKDKATGAEIEVPKPTPKEPLLSRLSSGLSNVGDLYKQSTMANAGGQMDMSNSAANALKGIGNTVKESYGPLLGGMALPLAVSAAQPEIGLPWLAASAAGGALAGEAGQRVIQGEPIMTNPEKYAKEALTSAIGEGVVGPLIKGAAKPVFNLLRGAAEKSPNVVLNTLGETAINPNVMAKGSRGAIASEVAKVDDVFNNALNKLSDTTTSPESKFPLLQNFYDKLVKGVNLSADDLMKSNLETIKNSALKDLEGHGWKISDYDKLFLDNVVRDLSSLRQGVLAAAKKYPIPAYIKYASASISPLAQAGLSLAEHVRDSLRQKQGEQK